MPRSRCAALAAMAAAFVLACIDEPPTAPSLPVAPPSFRIVDGAHGGGNPHFFFLPPIARRVSPAGQFDGSLEPVVEVCELVEGRCGARVARFTTTSGDERFNRVRVRAEAEAYGVLWRTQDFALTADRFYRIQVLVNAAPLGFADVDVVETLQDRRSVDRAEYVPLLRDSVLPIGFRIESGALVVAAANRLALGGAHACSLDAQGQAFCWGANGDGQLGDGTQTFTRLTPVAVSTAERFNALAPGGSHTCGLTTSGTALCWGGNYQGGLGDGTTIRRLTPVAVSTAERFTALAAGGFHTCGLTTTGLALCWGQNYDGQLGDGTRISSSTPVTVSTTEQFTALAASATHTCGITTSSAALCWGSNWSGQLGDGTYTGRLTPVAVSTTERFTTLVAGAAHTCGLTTTGVALCWGQGPLGDGTTFTRWTPVAVSTTEQFTALAAGGGSSYTCGLTISGAGHCWGNNRSGQLGDGTTTQRLTPAAVSTTEQFTALEAGGQHACGLTHSGAVLCWGDNMAGQLGAGTGGSQLRGHLVRVSPVGVRTTQQLTALAAGSGHTCGLTQSGAALCWGGNLTGQLGDGTTSLRLTPAAVSTPEQFIALVAGSSRTCGVTTSGAALCWGSGQLGHGTWGPSTTPVTVSTVERFTALAAGWGHTCGVTTSGAALCWGINIASPADFSLGGQLGDGTTTSRLTPVAVSTVERFTGLTAGAYHTCGVTTSGVALCWGDNRWGQLGDGTITQRLTPVAVSTTEQFTALAAGSYHTCGVTTTGAALCWGSNRLGQLGDGTTTTRLTPAPVSTAERFTALRGGFEHTCGLTEGGAILCWGDNFVGQLGDGTADGTSPDVWGRLTPVRVSTTEQFAGLAVGMSHTCGVTTSGAGFCWGLDDVGQLGDGWAFVIPFPRRVLFPGE